jgi:hypothetical protein
VNDSTQTSVVVLGTGGELPAASGVPAQQGLPNHPTTTLAMPGTDPAGKRMFVPNSYVSEGVSTMHWPLTVNASGPTPMFVRCSDPDAGLFWESSGSQTSTPAPRTIFHAVMSPCEIAVHDEVLSRSPRREGEAGHDREHAAQVSHVFPEAGSIPPATRRVNA